MVLTGVLAAGVASWLATPWVQMSRRGTLDAQTVATWRCESPRIVRGFGDVELPAQRTRPGVSSRREMCGRG